MNPILQSTRYASWRMGNTLVIALGVLSLVAAVIAVSSVGATTTLRETKNAGDRLQALAAVEAVLARHERVLLDRADSGALADFGTKNVALAVDNNYGLDVIGNCSVRWKIEPCRTQDLGETIDYIVNPAPTGVVDTGSGHRQVNRVNFVFRISAEASVRPSPDQPPTAVAQGARYAVAINEPLFRYIIFYAQSGPNGDLEFSHDPNVDIQGDVHSNGAIYVGSGTWVNHWGAAAGPSGYTKLGPDSELNPIRVTGVDGIFCLSKPLMFGALNGYTMEGIAPDWFSGWKWASVYKPLGAPNPVIDKTLVINPMGVSDAAKFNTNPVGSKGSVRQINGIDLYSGTPGGTDSRDGERSDAEKWNPYSLTRFANKVRWRRTGAKSH
jgi:type II secretory pathway pseudopilin PulG